MKKVLFPLMVLLAVACTVGIYYLVFDGDTTKLFYINTIVACLAEVLLLANIPIWSGEKMMTVKNAAVSVSINVYAVSLFLWSTIYMLGIYDSENENYKSLYIGLLCATLLFVIFCGATLIGGVATDKHVKGLEIAVVEKKIYVFSVQESLMNIKDALHDDNSEWKDETLRAMRTIADKIGAMPTEKLKKHGGIADELRVKVQEIEGLCESLSAAENRQELQSQITRKIDRLKNYLVTIKTIM
ncbi:MAG: hypothetical protein IKY64_04240 [Bacteroidaceae bacterium]|nr:hypothetical protein [Bacteroidaceae bacterium]